MSDTPGFASTREALGVLRAVLGYLSADAGEMVAEAQAECLQALEQLDGIKTATRARVLGAFTAAQGYAADADYSPRSWLIHRTRITKGAAAGHLAWVRRAAAHPRVASALAEGEVSESYAPARGVTSGSGDLGHAWPHGSALAVLPARSSSR